MHLSPITRAVDLRLARDLPASGPGRMPLLRQGTILTPRFVEVLATQGINAVWVEDSLSEGIAPVELMPEAVRSNVTALGLLLGRTHYRRHGWLDYRGKRRFDGIDARLTLLGMGLLLHDIGKMAIPSSILNKEGPLDDAEWELMRSHPEAGVALLNTDTVSPLVKSVVRDHHERWDGSGYPRGIAGDRISHFAQIAAVADVYDAVVSARPYKPAAPAHVGVSVIVNGAGSMFSEEVVDAFRAVVMRIPWALSSSCPTAVAPSCVRSTAGIPMPPWCASTAPTGRSRSASTCAFPSPPDSIRGRGPTVAPAHRRVCEDPYAPGTAFR